MKRSDYYFIMLAIYAAPKMPDDPATVLTIVWLIFALWNWAKESRKGEGK